MRAARWLIDLPTRLHLWSAEHELRHSPAPQGADDHARQHNLDVLRAYRRSRRFPHNTVATRPTPVFIDDDGRRRAVAHLMIESGAGAMAYQVAASQTYAYVPDIEPVALEAWARTSGLTTTELARIQPEYCYESGGCGPSPWWKAVEIALVALVTLGATTIIANLGYVVKAEARRLAIRLGRAFGQALLALFTGILILQTVYMSTMPNNSFGRGIGPDIPFSLGLSAPVVGIACIVAAGRSRRREWPFRPGERVAS